jgi:hypothetical protein
MTTDRTLLERLKDQIKPAIQKEVEELSAVLESTDKLVPLVLRFHLLSEYHLERIIFSHLPRGDRAVEKANLSYYQKLMMVYSLDVLGDRIITCLQHLNSLRYKCSHQKDVTITLNDI